VLEALGVNPAAETIYLAMLKAPEAGTAALAQSLGWPEEQVTAALDELARLSLLRPSWDNPGVLRPVSPKVGLEALLAAQRADLLGRQQQIERGHAALQLLVNEYAERGSDGGTAYRIDELVGLDAVRDTLEHFANEAQSEILAFVPDGAQTAAALEASRPLNQRALARGVRMRTLYLDSARNDPATTGHVRWLTEIGAQVRTVPVLPLRMLIIDRLHAVVPLDPTRTAAGACLIRGHGLITVALALFEQRWEAAAPWGDRPPAHRREKQPRPAPQEQALLELLALGDTDEQAARKLGVSTRTVGRMAADLMARLGARSRLQAGVLAAERGWVSSAARGAANPSRPPEVNPPQ
jgi:DNA-binding CsgD family transcriptional regulator